MSSEESTPDVSDVLMEQAIRGVLFCYGGIPDQDIDNLTGELSVIAEEYAEAQLARYISEGES